MIRGMTAAMIPIRAMTWAMTQRLRLIPALMRRRLHQISVARIEDMALAVPYFRALIR